MKKLTKKWNWLFGLCIAFLAVAVVNMPVKAATTAAEMVSEINAWAAENGFDPEYGISAALDENDSNLIQITGEGTASTTLALDFPDNVKVNFKAFLSSTADPAINIGFDSSFTGTQLKIDHGDVFNLGSGRSIRNQANVELVIAGAQMRGQIFTVHGISTSLNGGRLICTSGTAIDGNMDEVNVVGTTIFSKGELREGITVDDTALIINWSGEIGDTYTAGSNTNLSLSREDGIVNYYWTQEDDWWPGVYVQVANGSSFYPLYANDVTIVSANTYTITYDGNGNTAGTVPVDEASYAADATAMVAENTGGLARDGCIFVGWNTKANGSGTDYIGGNALTVTGDITLYAQWRADIDYFFVTYDGNGNTAGTAPTDGVGYVNGAAVGVADNTGGLAKDGCTFNGWNTSADGSGTSYAAGATFNISGNVTLYAQWNAAGGSAGGSSSGGSTTKVPKTGDNQMVALLTLLTILSGAASGVYFYKSRKAIK